MPKYRFDQLERIDSNASAFASRELEQIRVKTYDKKYPGLKARQFIPVDNSVHPGAETVTYQQWDHVGVAKLIKSYSDDFPRADVLKEEFTSKIRGIGSSYGYNFQEIRAAQFAGTPLQQRKANAARAVIEQKLDRIARDGDGEPGLLGLLNQSNTTSYTVANGVSGSPAWSTKTPDEIVADLNGIANTIVTSTKEVEIPDTILLPTEQYTLIASKRMGDGSDTTILKHFLEVNPYIKDVFSWHALTGAGTGGADRMVCYRRHPDVLQLVIPQEFEQLPPQEQGTEIVTLCHMRTGGVVVYYPLAIAYGDGI